jgi:hypothetical protein
MWENAVLACLTWQRKSARMSITVVQQILFELPWWVAFVKSQNFFLVQHYMSRTLCFISSEDDWVCSWIPLGTSTSVHIVDDWKSNLMSLAILFHLLCAQHVSDINISIFRSLRLCWWITTSGVLFSVRCVLDFWCGWYLVVFVLQALQSTTKYQPQQKLQHTTNWEQDDRCGNSSTQSQAPEDGYTNVRNMFSA